MSEEDAQLVARTLGGDRSAFEALVAAHLTRAQAVARAVLGNQAATDDVVQEAFLRAYDRLGQLTEPATFPSWLATIVRHEAVNWLRRSARVRNVELSEADARVRSDAEEPAEDPLLEPLRRALSRLSPDYREILALKYEAGCDYQKIAETLGLSLANVEKKLYRARQALLKLMPEIGKVE